MKTIVVATDFSPASDNALLYAVNMARFLGARVVLYNAYITNNYIPDLVLMPPVNNQQEEAMASLKNQVNALEFLDKSAIKLRSEPGVAADSIIKVAIELNASWIILGMKSSGLSYRKVFGSTALTLSRKSLVPMIIVPEDCIFQGVRSIALASDLTIESSVDMLDPLIAFVSALSSMLYVVNVRRENTKEINAKAYTALNIKWSLEELVPTFKFIEDENIPGALNYYINKNNIDMLALVAHEHSLIERVFIKSTIKDMMFSGRVPLMILPDK